MVWWLRLWCVFIKSWVQSSMDVWLNVSCTIVIYKHVYHGEMASKKIHRQNQEEKKIKTFHNM
jgi:hypothetical protein